LEAKENNRLQDLIAQKTACESVGETDTPRYRMICNAIRWEMDKAIKYMQDSRKVPSFAGLMETLEKRWKQQGEAGDG